MSKLQGKKGREEEETKSPVKKKSKDTLSVTEEALNATITTALLQQQQNLQAMIKQTIEGSLSGEIKSLTEAMIELKLEFSKQTALFQDLQHKYDNVQANMRSLKWEVTHNVQGLEALRNKLAEFEDRNQRNNLRLVGLPETAEGTTPILFLQQNLPRWIPALKDCVIEIERAHRIFAIKDSDQRRPRTLIFCLLRYTDRQKILQGARKLGAEMKHGPATLLIFPDYSNDTAQKRRAFAPVRKAMHAKGLQAFLIYLAALKINRQGRPYVFQSVKEAEDFLAHMETSEDSIPTASPTDLISERHHSRRLDFKVLSVDDALEHTSVN
ncbi:UNVERIFIED_CONTAM: hypothetical protein FKN15_034953 [Acipenser sinensis]